MNGHAVPSGDLHSSGWNEFCEQHAIITARELARKYLHFVSENPQHEVLAAENFSVQFADRFQQYFRNEVKDNFAMNPFHILPFSRVRDYRETVQKHAEGPSGTVGAKAEVELSDQVDRGPEARPCGLSKSWSSEELAGPASSLAARRHFSLDRLRRSWRRLFRRGSSEPGPGEGETTGLVLKSGLARKIFPWTVSRDLSSQVQKEGNLKYMMVAEDSGTRWQKCRLVLYKEGPLDRQSYALALFDPPKGLGNPGIDRLTWNQDIWPERPPRLLAGERQKTAFPRTVLNFRINPAWSSRKLNLAPGLQSIPLGSAVAVLPKPSAEGIIAASEASALVLRLPKRMAIQPL